MNQHDAETRQFEALVKAKRPVLAATLAFSRTPAGTKLVGAISFFLVAGAIAVTGLPHEIVKLIARFG